MTCWPARDDERQSPADENSEGCPDGLLEACDVGRGQLGRAIGVAVDDGAQQVTVLAHVAGQVGQPVEEKAPDSRGQVVAQSQLSDQMRNWASAARDGLAKDGVYVGHVSIGLPIMPGSGEGDPDAIAARPWNAMARDGPPPVCKPGKGATVRKLGMYAAPALIMLVMLATSPAGATTAAASAGAAPGTCRSWVHQTSPNTGSGDNNLFGVGATSARNAWAVGEDFVGVNTTTLIEHWNGKSWRVFTSPNKGTGDALGAVYAVSASDVWAAGSYYNGTAGRTLIEHFNGKSWSVVTSPNVGALSNEITALRGTSANDIWAVGDAVTSYPTTKTVILHWNGHRWRLVTSPSVPDKPNFLTAVRPVSASEAWAVGAYDSASTARTLIQHWTKGRWRIVPSPNVGTASNWLRGVRATSATDAWAIGDYYDGTADKILILRWNGHDWRTSSGPSLGQDSSELSAIGGTSAANAYAVGQTVGAASATLIMHWDGTRWRVATSPSPGTTGNDLDALYAQSPATAWAVGSYSDGGFNRTLIEQCR